jgi:hypothetical protein
MKFTRIFDDQADQTKETWTYDTDIFSNGPISVEIEYPTRYKTPEELLQVSNSKLPITKQQWINPANGKLVGYTRAKALGLIK